MPWLTDQISKARGTVPPSMQDAMVDDGYTPPPLLEPGRLIRIPSPGKSQKNKSAWCLLFDTSTAGMYGDFVTGEERFWRADGKSTGELSAEDRAAIERAQAKREEEKLAGHDRGKDRAKQLWSEASPDGTESHPYASKKLIDPLACRLHPDGRLILPIIDIDGNLINAQRIDKTGEKRYIYEARVDGGFIPVRGGDDKSVIVIAEGYATAVTIANHNQIGTVVAALNTANLPKVVGALREKHAASRIIIAADDDRNTKGNPGLTVARQTAEKYGCEVVSPKWRPDSPLDATDFNDLWAAHRDPSLLDIIKVRSPDLDLLLADDDDEFEKIIKQSWLYDDAIPSASVGIAYGPSGTGKSFFALDFAMSLASGRDWLGFEHGSGAQSSVLYISAEGGRGMRIRKRGWEDKRGIKVPSMRVFPRPYMLNEAGGAAALKALIGEYIQETGEHVSAVVVDTLSQSNSGDENTPQDSGAYLRACFDIAQSYDTTVFTIHHTGKDQTAGARGHSSLTANIDFEMSLTGGVDSTVRIECTKQKDIRKFDDISLSFDEVEITGARDYKNRPVKTLVAREASWGEQIESASRLGPDEELLIESYNEAGGRGFIEKTKIQQQFFAHPRIARMKINVKKSTLKTAIDGLYQRGMLTSSGDSICILARQDE